jgi:hypothetical protein
MYRSPESFTIQREMSPLVLKPILLILQHILLDTWSQRLPALLIRGVGNSLKN